MHPNQFRIRKVDLVDKKVQIEVVMKFRPSIYYTSKHQDLGTVVYQLEAPVVECRRAGKLCMQILSLKDFGHGPILHLGGDLLDRFRQSVNSFLELR